MRFRWILLGFVIGALLIPYSATSTRAQTAAPALLSLQSSATDVQTGQEYKVVIHVDNITELWLADLEIQYDPKTVYIMGTKAGSPVLAGAFMAPVDSTAVIRNLVTGPKVVYTVSMLAPANPVSGTGDIGSFRVYPLAPGPSEISFTKADLVKVLFATDDSGQRFGKETQHIAFSPVLLKLNVTGKKVDIPNEATATPVPSDTPEPSVTLPPQPTGVTPTALVNLTAAPSMTPTPLALVPVPQPAESSPLLLIAIIVVVLALVGLLVAVILWRRSRRR